MNEHAPTQPPPTSKPHEGVDATIGIDVDAAFDPEQRQAQHELDQYASTRPALDEQGNALHPATGEPLPVPEGLDPDASTEDKAKAAANAFFDQGREEAEQYSQTPYEELSMPDLARKLGEAEFHKDKTSEQNIGDVLLDKLGAQEAKIMSERDEEHNADRSNNLYDRVMSIKDKRKDELAQEHPQDQPPTPPNTPEGGEGEQPHQPEGTIVEDGTEAGAEQQGDSESIEMKLRADPRFDEATIEALKGPAGFKPDDSDEQKIVDILGYIGSTPENRHLIHVNGLGAGYEEDGSRTGVPLDQLRFSEERLEQLKKAGVDIEALLKEKPENVPTEPHDPNPESKYFHTYNVDAGYAQRTMHEQDVIVLRKDLGL